MTGNNILVITEQRDLTPEEIAELQAGALEADRQYWLTADYDEAVQKEIHEKYTIDQELAMHRNKDRKPEEYKQYDEYCEACKAYVKQKMAEHGREV